MKERPGNCVELDEEGVQLDGDVVQTQLLVLQCETIDEPAKVVRQVVGDGLAHRSSHPVKPVEASSKVFEDRSRIAVGGLRVLLPEVRDFDWRQVVVHLATSDDDAEAEVRATISVFQHDRELAVVVVVLLPVFSERVENGRLAFVRDVRRKVKALRRRLHRRLVRPSREESIDGVNRCGKEEVFLHHLVPFGDQ